MEFEAGDTYTASDEMCTVSTVTEPMSCRKHRKSSEFDKNGDETAKN